LRAWRTNGWAQNLMLLTMKMHYQSIRSHRPSLHYHARMRIPFTILRYILVSRCRMRPCSVRLLCGWIQHSIITIWIFTLSSSHRNAAAPITRGPRLFLKIIRAKCTVLPLWSYINAPNGCEEISLTFDCRFSVRVTATHPRETVCRHHARSMTHKNSISFRTGLAGEDSSYSHIPPFAHFFKELW